MNPQKGRSEGLLPSILKNAEKIFLFPFLHIIYFHCIYIYTHTIYLVSIFINYDYILDIYTVFITIETPLMPPPRPGDRDADGMAEASCQRCKIHIFKETQFQSVQKLKKNNMICIWVFPKIGVKPQNGW